MLTLDLAPAPRRLDLYRLTRWEEPTASLGHDCTTDLCNACSTRGHAREPGILLRARLPPLSAFAFRDGFPSREEPLDRVPLAQRVSRSTPPRSPARGSFGTGASSARALLKGANTTREGREMTPRSHAF